MSYLLLFAYFFWILKLIFLRSSVGLGVIFSALFVAFSAFAFLYILKKKVRNEIRIQKFLFCFLISLLFSMFWGHNYRLEDVLLSFMYLGLGVIPCYYKLNEKVFRNAIIIIIAFFSYHIIKGSDPNFIFSSSRNTISVILIVFYSYYAIAAYTNRSNIPLWPLPICLIISIWAIGRSGIFVFLFLTVTLPVIKYNIFSFKLIGFILFIFIVFYGIYSYFLEGILSTVFDRFDRLGFESDQREKLLNEYYTSIFSSIKTLLFGVNIEKLKSAALLDFNPHNSLVRLHMFYGLSGFLLIFYFLIKSVIFYVDKKEYLYVFLIFALLFRSVTDSAAFHGPLDSLFYYFIFSVLMNKENRKTYCVNSGCS